MRLSSWMRVAVLAVPLVSAGSTQSVLGPPVGPFELPVGAAVPLTIRLADPTYPAEDLGLVFSAAELVPVPPTGRP